MLQKVRSIYFLAILYIIPFTIQAFTIYQSTGYEDKQGNRFSMKKYGINTLPIIYEKSLWAHREVRDDLDIEKIDQYFSAYKASTKMICIDVEHYKMKSEKSLNLGVKNLVTIAKKFRFHNPGIKFGFYSTVPQRGYYEFLKRGEKLKELEAKNIRLTALADEVDIIFLSLYPFNKNIKAWRVYAEGMFHEAKKYNKRIIVFLSPQIHHSNRISGGQFVDEEFWQVQLDVVRKNASGLVIWSAKRTPQIWNENWGWWKVTKAFIKNKMVRNK